MKADKKTILAWLEQVKDPEIPTVSLIDLGVITDVLIGEDGHVTVKMTPTFAGCPAMDYMRNEVEEVLRNKGVADFTVEMNFDTQWSSNNITKKGLQGLKKHGLAPPPRYQKVVDLDILEPIECPHCGSKQTVMKSPFGPTLCRSLHYCNHCRQAFEQFKPV